MSAKNRDGKICGMPGPEYHSGPEISAGALKVLAQRTAAHFKLYRDGKLEKDSKSFSFGRNSHCALLEPERFKREYACGPDCRRGSKEWIAAELAADGRELIKPDEWGQMDRIWSMVRESCGSARWILDQPGETEVSIFWTDEKTGLRCRCRPDKLIILGGVAMVVEVKSTRNAGHQEFSKDVVNLGYHIAVPHYLAGVEAVTGLPAVYVFLLIESDTLISAVREISSSNGDDEYEIPDLEMCKKEWRRLMEQAAALEQSGIYPGYGDQVEQIVMPTWWRRRNLIE